MKNLHEAVKTYFKKVCSDLHSAIVGIIVTALILSVGGIYLISKNLWIWFKTIVLSPTPLWATTALVIVVLVYIYVKIQKTHSSPSPKNYITKYFTIGNYKWETKIYKSDYFEVDKYPYCVKHDLKFIFGRDGKYCPGTENERCDNGLREHDEFKIYESAKSIIENKVRNKSY